MSARFLNICLSIAGNQVGISSLNTKGAFHAKVNPAPAATTKIIDNQTIARIANLKA